MIMPFFLGLELAVAFLRLMLQVYDLLIGKGFSKDTNEYAYTTKKDGGW